MGGFDTAVLGGDVNMGFSVAELPDGDACMVVSCDRNASAGV